LVEARAFLGLIVFANGTEPATFYNDNSQITTTVQNIFAALAIITGDFIIVGILFMFCVGIVHVNNLHRYIASG
jgi:hypothetical protein